MKKMDILRQKYPGLSVDQLRKKIKIPIVFSDEFSKDKEKELAFLRSIVRSIFLPCILASTNAKISNMISPFEGNNLLRENRSVSCYLISLLPFTNICGLMKSITVEIQNGDDQIEKKSLDNLIEITPDAVNLSNLFNAFGITVSDEHKVFFSDFIKLIISQSSTCLQGISSLSLKAMVHVISEYDALDQHHPFSKIITRISGDLSRKSARIAKKDELLFYSIYSFALCPQLYDTREYAEGVASNAINEHYYFLGEKRGFGSNAELQVITKLEKNHNELTKDDCIFKIKSYFSNFKEDIILHISIWDFFHTESGYDYTIASIIKNMYDNTPNYYLNVEALSSNRLAQEFMTCFAMASASHGCLPDMTDGLTLLKRFVTQIQISHGTSPSFIVPQVLESFMKDLKIPYLIPQMLADQSSLEPIKRIVQLGVCKRLRNKEGFCISFSIFGSSENGVVEFKNVDTAITRGVIRKYMIRTMNKNRKLTIFLANKIGSSLKNKKEFNKFKIPIPRDEKVIKAAEEEPSSKKVKVTSGIRTNVIRETYRESMTRAFSNGDLKTNDFELNIYSLFFSSKERKLSDLKFETLHESSANPNGVFIIIESNCILSPKPLVNLKVIKDDVEVLEEDELNFNESEEEIIDIENWTT